MARPSVRPSARFLLSLSRAVETFRPVLVLTFSNTEKKIVTLDRMAPLTRLPPSNVSGHVSVLKRKKSGIETQLSAAPTKIRGKVARVKVANNYAADATAAVAAGAGVPAASTRKCFIVVL